MFYVNVCYTVFAFEYFKVHLKYFLLFTVMEYFMLISLLQIEKKRYNTVEKKWVGKVENIYF